MTLDELIKPAHAIVRLRAADKPRLLQEVAKRIGAALQLPPAEIAAALLAREALGSTGVGNGIAVPHAQLPQLKAPAGFIVQLERPVDFAAIDGRPVDLLYVLLSPPEARSEHLALLAAGTRRLRERRTADAMRAAVSPAALRALMAAA